MTIRNLKLTANHDLSITSGQLDLVSDGLSIVQAVKCRLSTFLGEWFLDENLGLAYFTDVLVKNPDPIQVRSLFYREILDVPGVLDVVDLTLDFQSSTRTLKVTFSCTTDFGEVTGSVQQELNVQ